MMAEEERRPLLSENFSNGLFANQRSGSVATQHSDNGESKDMQVQLPTLIPKLAAVVLSFTVTGLAQSAIGVRLFYLMYYALTVPRQ